MMFADDIVICGESRQQLEANFLGRSKTEYVCVNEKGDGGAVRLQGAEAVKVDAFKYLGSTVQSNGDCGSECRKRVQAGWSGWRKVAGVI